MVQDIINAFGNPMQLYVFEVRERHDICYIMRVRLGRG